MNEYPKEPWSQGAVLSTPITRKFHTEVLAEYEAREKRSIFANFSAVDEGRSRVLIAVCQHEESARRIVACVNACAGQPTELLEATGIGLLGKSIDKIAVFHARSMNAEQQRDNLLSAIKEANTLLAWHEEQIEGRYDNLIAEIEAAK
jgi:hypothetical protein